MEFNINELENSNESLSTDSTPLESSQMDLIPYNSKIKLTFLDSALKNPHFMPSDKFIDMVQHYMSIRMHSPIYKDVSKRLMEKKNKTLLDSHAIREKKEILRLQKITQNKKPGALEIRRSVLNVMDLHDISKKDRKSSKGISSVNLFIKKEVNNCILALYDCFTHGRKIYIFQ